MFRIYPEADGESEVAIAIGVQHAVPEMRDPLGNPRFDVYASTEHDDELVGVAETPEDALRIAKMAWLAMTTRSNPGRAARGRLRRPASCKARRRR